VRREAERQHDGLPFQLPHGGPGSERGDLLALPPDRRDDLRPNLADRGHVKLTRHRGRDGSGTRLFGRIGQHAGRLSPPRRRRGRPTNRLRRIS
jgi:hypothetical protein